MAFNVHRMRKIEVIKTKCIHKYHGSFLHICFHPIDEGQMTFRELMRAKEEVSDIPLCQVFPNKSDLIDNANCYHMFSKMITDLGILELLESSESDISEIYV